jgi:hypothetical protein
LYLVFWFWIFELLQKSIKYKEINLLDRICFDSLVVLYYFPNIKQSCFVVKLWIGENTNKEAILSDEKINLSNLLIKLALIAATLTPSEQRRRKKTFVFIWCDIASCLSVCLCVSVSVCVSVCVVSSNKSLHLVSLADSKLPKLSSLRDSLHKQTWDFNLVSLVTIHTFKT